VLPTTDALDNSIATAAMIEFSTPVMASTIPSVLRVLLTTGDNRDPGHFHCKRLQQTACYYLRTALSAAPLMRQSRHARTAQHLDQSGPSLHPYRMHRAGQAAIAATGSRNAKIQVDRTVNRLYHREYGNLVRRRRQLEPSATAPTR
jgi:hypothetical protein